MIHDLHLETLGWSVDGIIFEDEAEALWEYEAVRGPESPSEAKEDAQVLNGIERDERRQDGRRGP